jgi:hypothetical protein
MDMLRYVTPNPDLTMTTNTQSSEQMIDTKMQHQWREDMLPAECRAMLWEQTDHFLGKQPDIVLYDLSSHMNANKTSLLLLVIVNLQAWLTGEGAFLCWTTRSTSYASMTTPNLETPLGSLSLVISLLTSQIELSTLVLASGNKHWLTYARVLT